MSNGQILFTAAGSLGAAILFAVLGFSLWARDYPRDLQGVGRAYALWWLMVGAMGFTDGLRILQGLAAEPSAATYLLLVRLKIVVTAVAVWGLAYYVVYLWTGRPRVKWPLAAFAAAHAVVFLVLVERRLPARIDMQDGYWVPRLVLQSPATLPVLGALGALLFFLPPLILAGAYLLLWRRLHDRTQRSRVLAVSITLIVFFLAASVQFDVRTPGDSPLIPALAVVNLAAALAAFLIYHPPAWLQRRMAIQDLERGPGRPTRL